jgi:hypothetical protein
MKELFEYLAQFPVDQYGTSWVSAIQVVKETGISMEELWEITRKVKREAFLDCVTTNVPCAGGLLSVTITQRGRLWHKGEDYSHLPPGREKIYNLL